MRLRIVCPACSCRYAVIGAAFFCPACGHNAADLMFSQSIAGIRNALDALPGVRAAIPDRDTAETTARLLVENGLQNAVTAFQRYAEALKFRGLVAAQNVASYLDRIKAISKATKPDDVVFTTVSSHLRGRPPSGRRTGFRWAARR